MLRFPVAHVALLAAAALAGCGDDEQAPRAKEPAPASNDCATSERNLAVRDVIQPLPSGSELVPAESELAKDLAAEYRKGGAKSVDAREIRRGGRERSTVVIVANVPETAREADVVDGLREAAQEEGARFRELRVAGRAVAVLSGPGVAQAAAVVGPCAFVSITGASERRAVQVARTPRPL